MSLEGLADRASVLRDRHGRATHALISYEDYVRLVALQSAWEAEPSLDNPAEEWVDLADYRARRNSRKLVKVRKSRGLTQSQLGRMVGMPQSQISRLEKNPDASSLRLIRKIAKALNVPAAELV